MLGVDDEMTTRFTSDFHLSHARIIEYSKRPFRNIDEMNRELVARHNAVVQDDDVVYNVGDLSMKESIVPIVVPLLKGIKYLISGNHDRTFAGRKNHEEAIKRYIGYGFKDVMMETRVDRFLVNHLPYMKDDDTGHEARFPEWRPKNDGGYLLCGHVHRAWKTKDKMINVGVDQWDYAPVSLETLIAMTE
jgi:calcineurin-like phosphoesterase family protein